MATNNIYLSIVIPAYCEQLKIEADINAANQFLMDHEINGEIIVVDDGSTDETAKVAQNLMLKISQLKVLSYQPNKGKGYAIKKGVGVSKGQYIMFADSGLCVPYKLALKGLERLRNGVDIAIGSRHYPGAQVIRKQPLYRQIGSKVFWCVIKAWLPLPKGVTDTQCGFKLFTGEVARKLYSSCSIDGFMIDIEMLCKTNSDGWQVGEFPVQWANDEDTRYNPIIGTFQNFSQLFRIWRSSGKRGPRNNEKN